MSECTRCSSTEHVTIKARHRDGRIRIRLCRTCRNKVKVSAPLKPTYALSKAQKKTHDKLLKQHKDSMKRILTKQAAGGYEG